MVLSAKSAKPSLEENRTGILVVGIGNSWADECGDGRAEYDSESKRFRITLVDVSGLIGAGEDERDEE